jgi:hypothetical protein
MRYLLLLALLPFAAWATDKGHQHHNTTTVIIHEHRGNEAAAALIGAGITYWLVRRHHKRQPVALTCPEDRAERTLRECTAK